MNAIFAGALTNRYVILSASGGVTGTFNPIVGSNPGPNLRSTLSYYPTHAYLDLALNYVQPGGGFNGNSALASPTGSAMGSRRVASSRPVSTTLTPAGLAQTAGELPTAAQQTTFDAMNLFLGLITDPFATGRGDPLSADAATSQRASDNPSIHREAPPMAKTFEQRWSVWAAGYGGSQTTDGNAAVGSNTATSRVFGVAAGADYVLLAEHHRWLRTGWRRHQFQRCQ